MNSLPQSLAVSSDAGAGRSFDTIPAELRERPQWVVWRAETRPDSSGRKKMTKVPVCAGSGLHASVSEPGTWSSFDDAAEALEGGFGDGIGYVFTKDDPYAGIDLDGCRDPETGELEAWARQIIKQLGSYTEISPSGTGVHVIVAAMLPGGRRRKGQIEMYDQSRFFCMTGAILNGSPTAIADRQAEIEAIHESTFGPQMQIPARPSPGPPREDTGSVLEDDTLLDKARQARNGDQFARLFDRGDMSSYPSQSEADLALCGHLAFWTNKDPAQIDRLFRRSKLMRPKWDERHFADGRTYGAVTIEHAIAGTSEGYGPYGQRDADSPACEAREEHVREPAGAARVELHQPEVQSLGSSASSSATVPTKDRRTILIPGEHKASDGRTIEQGAHSFAGEVQSSLPPGTLYRWDRIVGEIVGTPGTAVFRELTPDRVRMYVDRHCRLAKWRAMKKRPPELVYVSCTRDLAGLVMAAAVSSRHVRELRLIIHHPVFAGPNFDLVRRGWNAEHGVLYDEPKGLKGIEPEPFDADALFDLLVDFPFRDQASQINMIGLLLTPLIRPVVGTVPIHLALSSIERTGKGMLIGAVLGHGILGATIPSIQLGEREEEREKRITSLILEGATVVHLDNIPGTRVLDSPSLSALTTSPIWKGRTLGASSMPSLPNTLTLVASANNLRASSEVAKRMVPIWLEPKTDKPETRSDFIHPDIHAYAAEKRSQTLSILLGMVLRWKEEGQPAGKQRLGGFEAWTSAIGGILELHGLGSPWLSNREEWTERSDEWSRDARTLVAAWAEQHGTDVVTAKQVLELVRETDTFLFVTGRPEGGQPVALARSVLTPLCDRPVGEWRVRRQKDPGRKTHVYFLQAIR